MKAFSSTLKRMREWNFYLMSEYDDRPLTEEEWRGIDKGEYSTFLMRFQTGRITLAPPPPPPTPKAVDPVANFKRGIKRDASLYPTLKDQKHWNNWNRSVIAQARAHDVSEVFDVNYSPNNQDDIALFNEKQSFVYSVLNKVVMTDQGKSFVREHEKDYDAQAVYRKLVDHASKSTAAELAKDSLIEYLSTMKLDSRWKGTTEGFILHWREQMRLLEDMLPLEQHYDSLVKKRMLESAVRQVPELANVKNIENNLVAGGQPAPDYDKYCSMLMSAAVQRDDSLKAPVSRSKHVVNAADTTHDKEHEWFDRGYLDAGDNFL